MRTILVDNHDSYSYNVAQLMAATFGVEPTVLANDAPEWAEIDLAGYDAVVLSPGPGRPEVPGDSGVALEHLRAGTIPVLGVCLGHQALGWLAGGTVVAAPEPRHGYLETIRHTGTGLFRGVPQDFTAVRYHSLCLAEPLPDELEATAWSPDGVVMAIRHRRLPWWGVQFHPESVASEHGAAILANFAQLVRARSGATTALRPPERALRRRVLDFTVPTEVLFEEVFADSRFAFWLDSSRVERGLSRFSFLGDAGGGLGEVLGARVGTGVVVEIDAEGGRTTTVPGSIFDVLEERLRANRLPWDSALPFDLAGGYVGYFGYEMRHESAPPTPAPAPVTAIAPTTAPAPTPTVSTAPATTAPTPPPTTHDARWMSATRMVAVDHETDTTWVLALTDGTDAGARRAQRWIDATADRIHTLRGTEPRPVAPAGPEVAVEPLLHRPRERYLADIEACRASLHAGESYELCLTNALDLPFTGSPLEAYRLLRRRSPAPYAAYLRFDDLHVLSSSPERFLTIDAQGTVESRPIKGTARRDPDPAVDRALRDALATSAKARAENLMIVDLLRNDLGRICETGSVRVPGFMTVESYATVHQLVSTVRGRLRTDVGPVAAVRAAFPGGSMTGAPKLRTMQILDALEQRPRGIYSGALGFFGPQGTADLGIVIRTATIASGRASIGTGGAIVLGSDPADEFDEMVLKAEVVVQAMADAAACPEAVGRRSA